MCTTKLVKGIGVCKILDQVPKVLIPKPETIQADWNQRCPVPLKDEKVIVKETAEINPNIINLTIRHSGHESKVYLSSFLTVEKKEIIYRHREILVIIKRKSN